MSEYMKRRRKEAAVCPTALRALLIYDSDTGRFYRRSDVVRRKPLGKAHPEGYVYVYFNGRYWAAHRLAWMYVHGRWPEPHLDHINGVKGDNRLANLRECDHRLNMKAAKRRVDNKSGVKGVWQTQYGRWMAYIHVDGKRINLGTFEAKHMAVDARVQAALRLFGEFHRDEG